VVLNLQEKLLGPAGQLNTLPFIEKTPRTKNGLPDLTYIVQYVILYTMIKDIFKSPVSYNYLKHLYQHETSSIKFKWWNG